MNDRRRNQDPTTRRRSARREKLAENSGGDSSQVENSRGQSQSPARTGPSEEFDDLDRGSYSTNHGFAGNPSVDAPGLHAVSPEDAPHAPGTAAPSRVPWDGRGRRRAPPENRDERLRHLVLGRLAQLHELENRHLEVESRDGVVTLRGSVRTEHERCCAESCADEVAGVIRVDNQICIGTSEFVPRDKNEGGG